MKQILTALQLTIELVRAEKTKEVKAQNYAQAGVLRDLEKDLLGKESMIQTQLTEQELDRS